MYEHNTSPKFETFFLMSEKIFFTSLRATDDKILKKNFTPISNIYFSPP